jgi:NAD(P)-dependent dehydrogenase (short-subunit alcohol dehydrogenase family)
MGKTVIVTGAGRGTGRLIASQFAARGWNVAAVDLVEDRVQSLAQEINSTGAHMRAVQVDVSCDRAVEAMVKGVVDEWKTVDVLVSMAGGYGPSFRNSHETPEDEWDMVVGSNMKGVFLCAKHVIPYMLNSGGGRIINFASNAGRSCSPVLGCSYTAAKTGVIGITRHLAKEYASRGIVVNTVAPGPLDGDRVADQLRDTQDRQALVASIPVGRLGRESEIAAVVMFLANDAPTYMTGAILDVNGGLVLAA